MLGLMAFAACKKAGNSLSGPSASRPLQADYLQTPAPHSITCLHAIQVVHGQEAISNDVNNISITKVNNNADLYRPYFCWVAGVVWSTN